ncbi:hypothetical protein DICA3_D10660 [Diutina catenulata]
MVATWQIATAVFATLGLTSSVNGNSVSIDSPEAFHNTFHKVRSSVFGGVFEVAPARGKPKPPDRGDCPPCFNCNLPGFECTQFSACNAFTGMCECRPGYGGPDCSEPLCGSLEDGNGRRPMRKKHETCDCRNGWSGINCNMCTADHVCDSFMPEGVKGTCYRSGVIVKQFHQMCDVTNKKIIDILKGAKPQVTFSCNKSAAACDFQFWIAQNESFYCDLTECDLSYDLNKNTTHYRCDKVACKCLPGRMLCGEKGSIDISDFLTETIKGPGDFSCELAANKCKFSEPSMNDLIQSVFGDPYITLKCASGECLHKSEIPGFEFPKQPGLTLGNMLIFASVALIVVLAIATGVYNVRKSPLFSSGKIALGDNDDTLDKNFNPVTLSFDGVSYSAGNQRILNNVFGVVKPRECLAIMGGSGAGKTTLLDILAGKNKNGKVEGTICVNGRVLSTKDYAKIVAFVDQEDHLIPTLTVYETVLNSALLRLPREMSTGSKEARVLEVLAELRILSIKDRVIGSDFARGISGGEKRRVSIACELVTSPSILFLDEPTSGLDSFNARNVIDTLVKLSRNHERTIVFTIHQPRSNIVALFDKMVLLSEGELVYSGDAIKCNDYFAKNGYRCPLGYNLADYLIDITVDDRHQPSEDLESQEPVFSRSNSNLNTTAAWASYAENRDVINEDLSGVAPPRPPSKLATTWVESSAAQEELSEITELKQNPADAVVVQPLKKASVWSQVIILSSRTFKNLYRNPRLLFAHYVLSFIVGLFCGYLYYDVSNDISGFQNRLGLFFFVLAFLGFSSFTGLHAFAEERIIFIRERAGNYYHPFSYYVSKILCDVIPLRVLPPVILISLAYPLVGLTMEHNGFAKAILTLVLFNVTVAVEMLIIGILIKEPGASTITAVLVLLLSLLFAGLFVNSEDLTAQIRWLEWISLFHYAYEALAINEVKDLILREKKYGLSIEVPGATILSTFGFNVGAFWYDVTFLAGLCSVFLVLGYLFLYYFTVERR